MLTADIRNVCAITVCGLCASCNSISTGEIATSLAVIVNNNEIIN
jgi:hypothetical protein